jgi:pimeloyl-ACP methyl ester carboxylesterase
VYENEHFDDLAGLLGRIQDRMREDGAHLNTLSTALGGYGDVASAPAPAETVDGQELGIDLIDLFRRIYDAFAWKIKYGWKASKVTWEWVADGSVESGLLVEPAALFHTKKYPMLVLLHPTQTLRKYSPSRNNDADDELTTQLAKWGLATMGYIVLAPDYPGLGDNYDVHPYCLETLAQSAVGMIRAVGSLNTRWDGRIFLMGYSEGGYASMVTAKELQTNQPDLNLVAAAALDGPYALSTTMHQLMLTAGPDYPTPYFMPYVVAGYGDAYPGVGPLRYENAVVPQVNHQLWNMMDGTHTGEQMDQVIEGLDPYNGPASVLTQTTLDALHDPDSETNEKFAINDGFYDWTPTVPVYLCHNVNDDSVPVGNTVHAAEAWEGVDNVTVEYFVDYIPGLGTVHAGSLVPAYLRAIAWINDRAGK